jgi:transcription initiation factor TFIIB
MSKRKQVLEKPEALSKKPSDVLQKCITGCKGWPIITDNSSGEILCGSCGRVLEERFLETVPLFEHDSIDSPKKQFGLANSLTMYDMNMTTIMSDRDGMGKSLSSMNKIAFYRLKILNTRSTIAAKNKTLRSALLFLNMLQMKLALPDTVAENSALLYRKAMRAKMTIGRKSKNLMCACIYAACKQSGVPRSLGEISLTSNIGKKELGRTYRSLVEEMDLSLEPFGSVEFLAKIANEAKVSAQSQRSALEILSTLEKEGLTRGKNPKAMAAASLYLACILNAEQKTQSEITRASGVTSTTIRARYYEIKKFILGPEER